MNLFNNPMAKNALANMSQEMRADYKQKGKKIYETIDFATSKYYNSEPTDVQKIMDTMKSGLAFIDLDEEDAVELESNPILGVSSL